MNWKLTNEALCCAFQSARICCAECVDGSVLPQYCWLSLWNSTGYWGFSKYPLSNGPFNKYSSNGVLLFRYLTSMLPLLCLFCSSNCLTCTSHPLGTGYMDSGRMKPISVIHSWLKSKLRLWKEPDISWSKTFFFLPFAVTLYILSDKSQVRGNSLAVLGLISWSYFLILLWLFY